jgi:hypothetical protein
MPRHGHLVEPEPVEERPQVAHVVRVAIRVGVLAQPVPAEVERDNANAVEQGRHAEPVAEVAGQPVEQDNRPALTGIGVREPLRAAILRQRNR